MSTARSGATGAQRQLVLSTAAFGLCFAAWGLVGAFGKSFQAELSLTPGQTALLVAAPVVLGALLRIPLGWLTDRHGGRTVLPVLMLVAAMPTALVPLAGSYGALLAVAALLGLAGASFAVGVGHVSRWAGAEAQGSALGVFGLGNLGQSAAVFLGPWLALSVGRSGVFWLVAALLVAGAVGFRVLASEPPAEPGPAVRDAWRDVLGREPLVWVLSALYFLTFGGFLAFGIYLPTLLQDTFALTPVDAGFRAAGFVVLATLLRPLGGYLADRIGGARLLSMLLLGLVPFALLLAWPLLLPFTVGALGCAALLGLGNGAVFKLVGLHFRKSAGLVAGVVGAAGGLGGFFPPLLLGLSREHLGSGSPAFVMLAAVALLLWRVTERTLVVREEEADAAFDPTSLRVAEQVRAGVWATLVTALLLAAIVVGSRNLEAYDAALSVYTFAVVFATWGIVYHYSVWLQKPPTRMFWRRGWQLVRQRGYLRSAVGLARVAATHLAAQSFIRQRSVLRWLAHQLLFWGCLLAVAITFPLVFGWVQFTSSPDDQMVYDAWLFGFKMQSFPIRTLFSWVLFHGLDFAAVLVLAGLSLFLWRRMRDKGARAVQSGYDFVPLLLLFAISVTGLALTVSTLWLRGELYSFIAILHALTVIAGLLYLPFGKFFHIFQRPAQLGVKVYQAAGEAGPQAQCGRCGQPYASELHIADLKTVLGQLGYDYRLGAAAPTAGPAPVAHWIELCPTCKRRSLAAAQLRLREHARG